MRQMEPHVKWHISGRKLYFRFLMFQNGSKNQYLGFQQISRKSVKVEFFPSMIFCGEAAKKTSIDGLKWRDLVMGRWWLVNFDVSAVRCPLSGVTKGFMC